MEMNDYFSRLETLISKWVSEIQFHTKSGSTDKNKYSEYIAKKLLNAAFSLNLEILGKNHPAVDLGDKRAGIAFQITSRSDSRKITKDLNTFKDENLNLDYRNGIRFFLLVIEKPNWQNKTIEGFNRIVPGFDAKRDIYTFPDIVYRLKEKYLDYPVLFQELKDMMEWQFGNKTGVPPFEFTRMSLSDGSRAYYEALRGSNGRFKNLVISDLILSNTHMETRWIDTQAFISGPVVSADSNTKEAPASVTDALPMLWNADCKHAVIVGDGGMGKTVSLLKWWEQLLEPGDSGDFPKPIPVFIALNEFNQASEGERKDFIINSIIKNYRGGNGVPLTVDGIMNIMKRSAQPGGDFIPAMVLLLDGFNEITVEKRQLVLELNRLAEQCPGLQMVMTSRVDMRGNLNWGQWNLIRLQPLTDEQVDSYLGKKTRLPERLRLLVKNPMMLTLYAATCEVQENHKDSTFCYFKERVESPGELLWNFIEAQVAKLPQRLGQDEAKIRVYTYLLRFLLSALGFEMEKEGLFYLTQDQVRQYIDSWCVRFGAEEFLGAFPDLEDYEDELPLGQCRGGEKPRKRAKRLRDIICRELCMLVEEGDTLRFLHQDFRDFFAARHVLQEIEVGLKQGEIPAVLREWILNYYVRRFMGEIEGEHYCRPYLVEGEGWKIDIDKQNPLYRALELLKIFAGCRGGFYKKSPCPPEARDNTGYAVFNIVTIWKEVRGELSGADLSGLDLTGVVLNGVRCSRYYDGGDNKGLRYLAAVFDGSRIHEKNLLFQGHTDRLNSAVYSGDGKKILSASFDKTIKEWDAESGECLQTLTGHTDRITHVVYSADGKKILSTSNDKTIKEWDVGTGECLQTFVGHTDKVTRAVYSSDCKKIISASWDRTIKAWGAGTGKCIQTLVELTNRVTNVVYGQDEDKKKILSVSADGTINEWDADTGRCLQTLAGHRLGVTSAVYSGDERKILSASYDRTIKEWDVGTGECLQILTGHKNRVRNAVYSRDGRKILSASDDNTIKEWDVDTGECLQTLTGHRLGVTSAVYSKDGEKILSASFDRTIKEWGVGTGECLQTLAGHWSVVKSSILSGDGEKILSASADHTIKEWDAETGQCLQTLTGHTDYVTCAVYNGNDKKILSTSYDNTIKEWDAVTGECMQTLAGHTSAVLRAVFSGDDKMILSASADGTFKEWDVATGQCLKTYQKEDKSNRSEYLQYPFIIANKKLRIDHNKIFVSTVSEIGKKEKKIELVNIPGLWIQGCSFKNLEKGSQWTEEGLRLLKQYGGIVE